jgi:steroid 5-alpha reductase family enzyme
MSPWLPLAVLAALASVAMTAGWAWQRRHRNAGIVDVIWAAGLAAAAVLMAALENGAAVPRIMTAVLGGAWGLRLAAHLWLRVCSEPEDGRYRALRARWQGSQAKFLLFFLFQALLVVLFSLPFLVVARNRAPRAAWLAAGVLIWLIAVLGESVADRQLARFRADPANRGRTCRQGLWRYSRHPNYFFEWLHWFAYVALAQGAPLAALAWTGPVLMLVFLRWVSGIPFTEAQALRSRGDDYRDYQVSTSMLVPWFPKRGAPQHTGSQRNHR